MADSCWELRMVRKWSSTRNTTKQSKNYTCIWQTCVMVVCGLMSNFFSRTCDVSLMYVRLQSISDELKKMIKLFSNLFMERIWMHCKLQRYWSGNLMWVFVNYSLLVFVQSLVVAQKVNLAQFSDCEAKSWKKLRELMRSKNLTKPSSATSKVHPHALMKCFPEACRYLNTFGLFSKFTF